MLVALAYAAAVVVLGFVFSGTGFYVAAFVGALLLTVTLGRARARR